MRVRVHLYQVQRDPSVLLLSDVVTATAGKVIKIDCIFIANGGFSQLIRRL